MRQLDVSIPKVEKRAVGSTSLKTTSEDTALGGQAYEGNIGINSQQFAVWFDTGSPHLWVPAKDCDDCPGKQRYNMEGKQISKGPVQKGYITGAAGGFVYSDTVTIGSLTATDVAFIAATKVVGFESNTDFEGIMGLSYHGPFKTLFIDQLVAQEKLDKPEFSFFLGRPASGTVGQLTIGGVDSSLYSGPFTTVPSVGEEWEVHVDGIDHNGQEIDCMSRKFVVDTGTAYVVLDHELLETIAKGIDDAHVIVVGRRSPVSALIFPCKEEFNHIVAFKIGGKEFAINSKDLVIRRDWKYNPEQGDHKTQGEGTTQDGDTTKKFLNMVRGPHNQEHIDEILTKMETGKKVYCVSSLFSLAENQRSKHRYILGSAFLKNWYTKFDRGSVPSVSFAVAKLNQ